MTRELVASAHRTVVKVGSSSLTSAGQLDPERLDAIVEVLAARHLAGQQVVLVSSGAIAAGIGPLGLRSRPRDLATQQAAASVGQLLLVERYAASFARYGLRVGQVLLTADDLHRRGHYRNADRTLERLLALGVIPIVNENDTVATHEIRFGDNDRLAALVAHLVHADALVLLTDVDGLYTGKPGRPESRFIPEVHSFAELAGVKMSRSGSHIGSGGMVTKIDAAAIATSEGIPVVLASAEHIAAAVAGTTGTVFHASGDRTASRLFWLRHATTPRGRLVLDAGAVAAVVGRRTSLLPAGVTAIEGDFDSGDPVELVGPDGVAVGRGLVGYDAADLPALLGRKTGDLPVEFRREIVHRDDLVLL
ncbi:MAG: glutamate 5-kinase [Pseudonocardiales bacterium]|jgi:glutamate 5-kinase|nr:glutamate 5-kinase [Pseudonocardiales bacterium]MDT4910579.1 glutamate 5-kinase [Pseudonocardiales bacterium]MDT4956516.1 glutamate 5-kinase [Pseudonocardiales bacterium]MDT4964945.1 glutamate 5-kinase [Pseudonocardiales bacterium]MDT4972742.1 glutamate 5-kinase [Pseudonocardiales bacterium]